MTWTCLFSNNNNNNNFVSKKPFVRPFEDDYDATTNQAKNCQKKPTNQHVIKEESSKGQIISEGNCGVFQSPKKQTKFFDR